MPLRRRAPHAAALAFIIALFATACASDELSAPPEPAGNTLTVDASAGWAFASVADESLVSVSDPAASAAWDVGFNATSVMLNGGAAGPGGVTGFCLCQNAGASDADIIAMTAEAELADFDAVSAADIPVESSFETETLQPAIQGWYGGTGAGAVAAPEQAWLLRLEDGTSYAKLRVTALAGPTDAHAGQVTLEYAVQPAADAAFEAVQTVTLDASSATGLDLNTGSTAPAAGEWDVSLEGFTLRTNGGVSGSGAVGATPSPEPFEAVTTAAVDSRAYQADRFAGVFGSHPWYKYNLTGENIIHPTFDVYLVKRGADVYKVQLIDYYSTAGEPRNISIRYALLTE
ncbi:MAG: HmuY family protein [Gemmatimonadales bacterium]